MNEEFPQAPKPEQNEEHPTELTTEQGSVYRYLPDGRTQRFKTVTGELKEPQDTLVFIPPYDLIGKKAMEFYPEIFKGVENEVQFIQILLEYAQKSGRTIRVVDSKGTELKNNQEVTATDQALLHFVDNDNPDNCFFLPATKEPKIGYLTYDTRKYVDEEGETVRERHLGNKIVDIKYSA